MAKTPVENVLLDFTKPIQDQASKEEIMAICEEFAQASYNEHGRKVGYDTGSRMCACCTISMLCLSLSYKLNRQDLVKKTKAKVNAKHFYSEYSSDKLDELFETCIITIKKYTEKNETVKKEKLLAYLEKQVTGEDIKSETEVFAHDVLARIIEDPRIICNGNEITYKF